MPGTTSRLSIQYPTGTDAVNVYPPVALQAAGVMDNAALVTEGTFVARPAVGTVEKDRIYKATDVGYWYISDGTNWNTFLIAGAWQALSLGAGFTNAGVTYDTASARLEGDTVRFRGAVVTPGGGTFSGQTVVTPPAALQPNKQRGACITSLTGAVYAGTVTGPNLVIWATAPGSITLSLEGIAYPL